MSSPTRSSCPMENSRMATSAASSTMRSLVICRAGLATPEQSFPASPTSTNSDISAQFDTSPQARAGEPSKVAQSLEKYGLGEHGEPSTPEIKAVEEGDGSGELNAEDFDRLLGPAHPLITRHRPAERLCSKSDTLSQQEEIREPYPKTTADSGTASISQRQGVIRTRAPIPESNSPRAASEN